MENSKAVPSLYAYLQESGCLETEHSRSQKESLVKELQKSLDQWIKTLTSTKFKDLKIHGKIHVFGSFAVGTSHAGGDIDCVALLDSHVMKEDFFSSWYQYLQDNHNTTNARKVETAVVPLIRLCIDGIEVDMLFACLNRPGVIDILPYDDTSLASLDATTIRVINGVRETQILMGVTPNFDSYKLVSIAVKLWVKKKQLYGDILGSLPGICCSIMVSLICQQHPEASPEQVLLQFFKTYNQWDWQRPVMLRPLRPNTLNLVQWNPGVRRSDAQRRMQVITPAYPEINVTSVLSAGTFHMLQVRLGQAVGECEACISGTAVWSQLFAPATDFFTSFKNFIMIQASATGQQHKLNWLGLVGSRVFVLEEQLNQEPALELCWLLPKTFHKHAADTDIYTDRWFLGLRPNAAVTHKLDLASSVQRFLNTVQGKGQEAFINTDDMTLEVLPVKRCDAKTWISEEEATFYQLWAV